MITEFKPMLAGPADLDTLRYPCLGSTKLDGIRAMVRGGRLVSRKLLDIPNKEIQAALSRSVFEGLDGELIVGDPKAHDVYNKTVSFVMAGDKTSAPWKFYVFDHTDCPGSYVARRIEATRQVLGANDPRVGMLAQTTLDTRAQLDDFETECITYGYEGIMLRDPNTRYKYGRSTPREQILLKVKRFVDSEAEIISVEEEMANLNEAGRDELGRTKRSTAQAGKVGKGTMGALVVKDLTTGVVFNIGSGFTAAQRAEKWIAGDIVTYKFFPVGVKDKPRHPIFKGRRALMDIGVPA